MNQKWTALLLTTAMLATGASAALAYETLQPGSNAYILAITMMAPFI